MPWLWIILTTFGSMIAIGVLAAFSMPPRHLFRYLRGLPLTDEHFKKVFLGTNRFNEHVIHIGVTLTFVEIGMMIIWYSVLGIYDLFISGWTWQRELASYGLIVTTGLGVVCVIGAVALYRDVLRKRPLNAVSQPAS